MPFTPCSLDELTIIDERSFRHVALYDELKQALRRDNYTFLVPTERDAEASWSRVLFLNLTYWNPETQGDVLASRRIDADVVAHVAWHHLARKAFARESPCAGALLFGEAIASAFDLYLVGRLMGHAPQSTFLETQVPEIDDAAACAGLDEDAVEALFLSVVSDPERAFEELRELLFDTSMALLHAGNAIEADAILEAASGHRFGPLLHHYELSTWVLFARAYAPRPLACGDAVRAADAAMRRAPDAVAWLEAQWLDVV